MLTLSVIIVNWNSRDFTRKCLASLYCSTTGVSLEAIVIDNASFDGCEEMVRREYPQVRFIQNRVNAGFARANNLACEHANGTHLLFLNPDAEIIGIAVERMVVAMESLPEAGIVGPKLLNTDLSVQASCVRAFPSIFNRVVDCEYFRRHFPNFPLWGNCMLHSPCANPVPVEAISGACLMIRKRVFESVGRFNPTYFMSAEDTDLCYRVQEAGWKNYYVGGATVIHHGGESSNAQDESQFSSLMMKESLFKYFRIHRGVLYANFYRSAMALAAMARLIMLLVARLLPLSLQRRQAVSSAWVKWIGVMRWAIGLETWLKQYK